jgi:alkanesulfonate monooxygenase SsuD/methylene tetrahydromethanopterin reductase-like flavin-dependent oxidoreductase (luciferase family)
MSAKHGIFVPPFDALAEPRALAELAVTAEGHGWDGFFLWDHVAYREPVRAVADPWVAMAAIACATERLRIGPMVTPLARRRVHKLARETVTLDRLSRGRLTLGVGLGSDRNDEFERFGEVTDARERARLLDDGLAKLTAYWDGELEPPPAQDPRIPIWVASRWPNRRPLRRAARWDGLFPIDLPGPDALAELVEEVQGMRPSGDSPFDIVVEAAPEVAADEWEAAGATWVLASFGYTPALEEVRRAIEAGPV